jgi:hypothetical protein
MLGAQGDAPHVGGPPIKAALQERRVWVFADPAPTVTFDNQFSGARVNACTQIGPREFKVLITPENEPINPSPWYAFRVRADASVCSASTFFDDTDVLLVSSISISFELHSCISFPRLI